MRKLARGDGPVGSGGPGRSGTVRALVRKLARGDGPGGSGTVRDGPGGPGRTLIYRYTFIYPYKLCYKLCHEL